MAKKVRRKDRPRTLKERLIERGLLIAALVSVVSLAMIFYLLIANSLPAFLNIDLVEFFTSTEWRPSSETDPSYGAVPLFIGTLLVSLVAAAISIPIGIGCTIYISELANPRLRSVLKPVVEVLAGIPSVVFGFFALVILSTWVFDIFDPEKKLNALNGAIILAVMMIPIMVSVAEDAINSVPRHLREASLALGATKWETIRGVVLPASLSGIIAAIVLAFGRAIGETMVVIMATGNAPLFDWNILDSVQTMTAAIAIDFGEVAEGTTHYHVLFAVGVVLFVFTFIINTLADYIMHRFSEEYK